jgi:hypothetical protein
MGPKMLELKFRDKLENQIPGQACCNVPLKNTPAWVSGNIVTPIGSVLRVSSVLSATDYWEHFKCRTTSYRNDYTVNPGLYAVGDPGKNSHVLVTANYKYSFDTLRSELEGLDAWILVLDTKGINVWCAAGKGTFGTAELVKRISAVQLDKVVAHRQVIVPQLGAPGVSAFRVKQTAGFKVLYGPVRAKDVPAYINEGYKATREMRRVKFSLSDRLVLTPMEINPAMKKFPLYAALVLVLFGLSPSGIMFKDAFTGGLPFLFLGLVSVFSGALLTPALLPYVPFRSFAVKGWITGLLSVFLSTKFVPLLNQQNIFLLIVTYLFFPQASSYIALQFTGSTTFTGMSGVKRELRIAIPTYLVSCAVSLILLVMYKFTMWGVI